eukprot:1005233_1
MTIACLACVSLCLILDLNLAFCILYHGFDFFFLICIPAPYTNNCRPMDDTPVAHLVTVDMIGIGARVNLIHPSITILALDPAQILMDPQYKNCLTAIKATTLSPMESIVVTIPFVACGATVTFHCFNIIGACKL